MEIYGYEIDATKGFKCIKGNSEHMFKTYEEACEFQREHYGYTIIYYMANEQAGEIPPLFLFY